MAIRFKYDAAAVAIPQNEARQRFGQQLVLQQQKYANDQRQGMQDRMYDQQREYRQTAFQLQKAQTDRFVDNQRIQDQQKFAEKMQKNSLDAQQQRDLQEAQQRAQMMAKQQEMQRVAQLKAQQRADDEDAIRSGGYDPITALELKKNYARETKIDLDEGMDEAMRADAHSQNLERRRKLQEARIAVPSLEDKYNQGVKYRDPKTGKVSSIQQPDSEIVDMNTGSSKSQKQVPQLPSSYEEYIDVEPDKADKALDAKMAELRDRALDGGKQYDTDEELENAAYAELKGKYERQRSRAASARQMPASPAQPPMQGGQLAAPAAQPPAMGMQDLEPTYNADGTTSVPGQPVGDPMMRPPMLADPGAEAALPAAQGQPATAPMRAYHQDGRIFEQSPDGNWREFKDAAKQPIQQADGSLWQQSPEDGAWRVVPPEIQPFRPEPFAMPPARPLQSDEEEGMSTFAPKAPGVMQQPTATLPVDQTGMQPPQQNVWAEVAAPEQQAVQLEASSEATVAPDFIKLSKNAANDSDRMVLGKMQDVYKNAKTPEIQNAISVLVTPGVPAAKKALAARVLRAAGIDLNKLIPSANTDASGIDFSSAGVM